MIHEISLNSFGREFAAFVPKPSVEDIKLANALADDAEQNAVEAGRQRKYAEMAQALITNAENDKSRTELTQIAVWHYKLCGASFRQSVVGFESAAKIQKDQRLRRKLLK